MLIKRIPFILTVLVLTINLTGQTANRVMIDSGHSSGIESLVYHTSGVLLSTDNTGLVKVWDLASNSIRYQVSTGVRGAIQVKVHPQKTEFALLVSRPGFTELSVWDWEKGTLLFRKELQDRPLQFEYSGQGRFLFMTRISSPSIVLMDSQSGREYSYLKKLYDLISYGYIGASESRVMTYSSSGMIKYWDIRTSALKSEAETVPSLTDIEVLQTEGKRYISARKGSTIYLIDRLNGSVRDSLEIEDLLDFSLDSENGFLSVTTKGTAGRLEVYTYTTQGAFFSPVNMDSFLAEGETVMAPSLPVTSGQFTMNGSLTGSLTIGNRIFLSDSNGTIWNMDPSTLKPAVFKQNNIAHIKDLNFMDNSLFILSTRNLFHLESDSFGRERFTGDLQSFNDMLITESESPLPGDSEIEPIDNEKMLIWTKESVRKGYIIYNPVTGDVLNSNYNFESPLNQIHVRNNQVLVLENSGEATLNNIHTGFRDFQFSALGMVSLNFLNDTTLLGGKSLMKTGRNSIFTVQTDTGEIIPITDERFLIYDIFSPSEANRAYTVGLAQVSDTSVKTTIRSHNAGDPETSTSVFSLNGEWINARFTADTSSYSPTLYGTISGREIIRISGTRKKTWEYPKNIEKIFYNNGMLYILNSEGSISLFNPLKGQILLDFYLMNDGTWIAVPYSQNDRKIFVSQAEAADFLRTYNSTGRSIRNSYYIKKD